MYVIFDQFSETIKKFNYKLFIREIPFKHHCAKHRYFKLIESIFRLTPMELSWTIVSTARQFIRPLRKGTTLFVLKSGYADEYRVRIVINLNERRRRYNSRYRC